MKILFLTARIDDCILPKVEFYISPPMAEREKSDFSLCALRMGKQTFQTDDDGLQKAKNSAERIYLHTYINPMIMWRL